MSTPAFLHTLLTQDRPLFRKVVEAVVDDGLDYRPDPKSRCSRELIGHLIGHHLDTVELLDDGVIHHRNQVPFASLADAAKQLDDACGEVLARLAAIDESAWIAPAKFYVGEQVIMELPRRDIAWLLYRDSIHHRGQLTTHLRITGSKVPALYGPSADDAGSAH